MPKRALLVGITYEKTSYQLTGCINDIKNIGNVLKKIGYDHIVVLKEKEATKANIIKQLNELVSTEADQLWFHYSGHGSHIIDTSGDELDGQDEVICPIDYNTAGVLTDDLLNQIIQKTKSPMIVIMDCCHSGTNLDLKYHYDGNNIKENDCNIEQKIIEISGCMDGQKSADTVINKKWQGAMTAALLDTLEKNNYSISVIDLISKMKHYLKEHDYDQIPQVTSSIEITEDTKFL